MIKTTYGEIPDHLFEEFCKTAGHKVRDGEWVVISDQLEYWQLVNPTSTVIFTKWKKKPGWLPVRDLNFQFAIFQNPSGIVDLVWAIEYAQNKLFQSGKPIYLPEWLAEKNDATFDTSTKPPKGYNLILEEESENFKSLCSRHKGVINNTKK